jgi:small neutral amino acid transporter SnatA (MarC family)
MLLVFWLVWTTFLLMVAPLDRMIGSTGIYSVVTTAIFAFAMAAFGFDAYTKQMAPGPKPP